MSVYIPIELVNYICSFLVDEQLVWYPQFSPKTNQLCWKVNPYSLRLFHSFQTYHRYIMDGDVLLIHHRSGDRFRSKHRSIVYECNDDVFQLYIEFNSETDGKSPFVYRTFVHMIRTDTGGYYMVGHHPSLTPNCIAESNLYLNGTLYGYVTWIGLQCSRNNLLTIDCDMF